jgi:hypothetical protein
MTSFSLLNFKFTQIFLMSQNSFFKMTELSVNAAELSVNSTELLVNLAELSANVAEFQFFRRLLFLSHVKHDSTEF